MIDIAAEEVISLIVAAKRIPRRRRQRPTHVATLYRWSQRGIRGVRLETIQVGGTKCTSIQALQRFFEALDGPRRPAERKRPDRRRRQNDADQVCRDAGI